jgi:hypothetical protein
MARSFWLVRLVVRERIELPTFRFSGARITVSARPRKSFTVLTGHPQPAINPRGL